MARLTSTLIPVLVVALALSACHTPPARDSAPPAPLELLNAAPLELADDCDARGSYFVAFIVDERGRTANIEPPPGPACVRDALTAWVSSFQYAPVAAPIPSGVEWLLTTGKRGS